MRRGRALAPHPGLRRDDAGREVLSRQAIALLAAVSESTVRRGLLAVACDVATRATLYDLAEAQAWLGNRSP